MNNIANEIITHILQKSRNELCSYLQVGHSRREELLNNFVVKSEISGHNHQIFLIDFFDGEKTFIGDVCLKYSADREKVKLLQRELNILNVLGKNGILCPRAICLGSSDEHNLSYLLMEAVKGECVNSNAIDLKKAELILDAIQMHESVLRDNLDVLELSITADTLYKKYDFENKLSNYLTNFAPGFTVKDSLNFLNAYLNAPDTIEQRIISTDRSVDNIFINKSNEIIFVDFSTVRIGTRFDNWVQFIDDPRAKFLCSREELMSLFLRNNKLPEKYLDSFLMSAIYTDLLQGIFTYGKNPELGTGYVNSANDAFKKVTNKKGVLIDINH